MIKTFKLVLVGVALGCGSSAGGASETYPSRNITMVVPFAPGGVAGTIAQIVATAMEKNLQKAVVIEHRPGTGPGMAAVARAEPDGHTILIALNSVVVIPESLRASGQKPPYELAQLAPIAMLTADPSFLLVRPDSPWQTAAELFADAKKRPGEITYASSGTFGVSHMAAELIAKTVGVKFLHVPYRGGAPSMTALLSKDVDFTLQSATVTSQNVSAGNARALGAISSMRAKALPNTPSLKEQGFDVEVLTWSALFVPAHTSQAVRQKLVDTLKEAISTGDLGKKLEASGAEIRFMHGIELEQFLAKEADDIAQLVKDISLKN